jgi:hypothetical protein
MRLKTVLSIALVLFGMVLNLSKARKGPANQTPLGISRATSHVKQIRLSGPLVSPTHRLEEQQKLKNKVMKQVEWKGRMYEQKLVKEEKQKEIDLENQIELDRIAESDRILEMELKNKEVINNSKKMVRVRKLIKREVTVVEEVEDVAEEEIIPIKRKPLFKKLLLKRKE